MFINLASEFSLSVKCGDSSWIIERVECNRHKKRLTQSVAHN